MNTSSGERNPVELLAEDFLDRKRRGERPTLREYLERHPELAEEIRDLFPALLMIEDLGEGSGATTGSMAVDDGPAVRPPLHRLGDYRILREIGRGGMGVVYEAEQESLGRRVALKVLSAGALADPKQVRRFDREARAAARLHHTNIVPVFGVGCQDGHHYFVMQFIAGLGLDVVLDDLRRLRGAKSESGPAAAQAASSRVSGLSAAEVAQSLITGRFAAAASPGDDSATEPGDDPAPKVSANGFGARPPSSAVLPGSSELSASSDPDRPYYRSIARIGIQVAEALEYANRQGILHRDVKPSNLLLDNHANVWVADFGLAKTSDADDLTHTGDLLGTIRYMAPERFAGHCDARSDVYSLGLTLYELIALQPAFEASDRRTLMDRVLHEEPERLKKQAPGVPRDLETIVAKATARDPAARYATAGALAEDLRRFVEDRPIRARRISPMERGWRWCRRNKVVAILVGLAASTLVGVAVLAVLYAGEQRHLATARQLYADEQARRADEQAAATRKMARMADDLKASLAESTSRLAMRNFERGRAAFERGQIDVGMLWTVEALRMAERAGDPAWKRVALANLSAWRRQLVELKGVFHHGNYVSAVAFSPDGKTIVTGCADHAARLWDAATGRPIGPPLDHMTGAAVVSVAFSPDGKTVLTGSHDKTARLWDADTGRPIGSPVTHPDGLFAAALSPDGRTILTGGFSDKAARLWDAATGRPIGPGLEVPDPVDSVAFSPDGRAILTGSADGTARLWDAATGRPIGPPMPHPSTVRAVAFSPDGRTLLTGCDDKTARLWDADTGRPVGQPMPHSVEVRSVAFSPDGRAILTGSFDKTARLWDADTGRPIGLPLIHQDAVWAVAFSPDGRTFLTGCADGSARLWDGAAGQTVGRTFDHGDGAGAVAFLADGKTLLAASAHGRVRRWDVASGNLLGGAVEPGGAVLVMAVSPDGRTAFTGGWDRTARRWDADTGRSLGPPIEDAGPLTSAAFSPDGRSIVSTSHSNAARRWDAATGRSLGPGLMHPGEVTAAAFSPDGRSIVTACGDGAARRWDAATGRLIGPPMKHPGAVHAVAFSPDGRTLLTSSALDHGARRWDAGTCRPIGPDLEHPGVVAAVAFSPDGRSILTGGDDRTLRLWDADTGQPIGPPLGSFSRGMSLAFSPDGRSLLVGGDQSLSSRLWAVPAPLPDDLPRLAAWVEVATGLELDERGSVRALDGAAWRERRRRLDSPGGPPPPDFSPRLDPILYGPAPTARGDAWKERGRWERAEAAYTEAARARPLNSSILFALTRLHSERGRFDRAAATLAEAVRLRPDDPWLLDEWGSALLASGDRAGWRAACAELVDRFRETTLPLTANSIAWCCSKGPDAAVEPEVLVRLAERAVRGANADYKPAFLNTLGAALYRAGRYDEAIRRLEEGIRLRGGESLPQDWEFLAMAHFRLGHREEARRWLDRLRDYQPSTASNRFWNEVEIRLLRSEAEAVVVYDPVFPEDPFAR
jgi:eukaryotic-like serine/threonine-protein kinase